MQQFIQSIPQSQPHIRNDFSDIGIPPPGENWETGSIASISATAVPYTQVRVICPCESKLNEANAVVYGPELIV